MSTRTSSAPELLLALLALASCSPGASQPPPADDPSRIECALAGAAAFVRSCWVEHHPGQLVVRHPDGGFRVFDLAAGFAAADGADLAQVTQVHGGIEVTVAGDRYRLPEALLGDGRP